MTVLACFLGVLGDPLDSDPGVGLADFQDDGRKPAGDVARHLGLRERGAPRLLGPQILCRDGDAGAAPDADPAVVFLKRVLQRLGGDLLQLRLDRGADGEAVGKELLLAELAAQLAADFVGEVVARRQLPAERREVAVLHGLERQRLFAPERRLVEIAVLPHLAQDVVAPFGDPVLVGHGRTRRRLRHRGQHRRLVRGKLVQLLVEIGLRGRRDPVAVLAEKDLVEVEFEDLVLGQGLFDPHREDQFLDLAFKVAVRGQQDVLDHLLRDGGRAAHVRPARHHRLPRRARHADRIEAVVNVEVLVLGADEGVLHQFGNLGHRLEQAAFAREFVDQPALARIDPADGLGRIGGDLFVAGQVLAVHPEHAPHQQRSEQKPGHEPGKDAADEGQKKTNHEDPFGRADRGSL